VVGNCQTRVVGRLIPWLTFCDGTLRLTLALGPKFNHNTNLIMSIAVIKAFSENAKTNPEAGAKLLACVKIKELLALAKEQGFNIEEDELYPPNEPQFTAEQLSPQLGKALLRA